jgi:simple sugar transport system substrate-binding protein
MSKYARRAATAVLALGLVIATGACSNSGGKKAEEDTGAVSAGKANTPAITIAMVTHAAPGDTFWDIIRKGAEAAAAKDNVKFHAGSAK